MNIERMMIELRKELRNYERAADSYDLTDDGGAAKLALLAARTMYEVVLRWVKLPVRMRGDGSSFFHPRKGRPSNESRKIANPLVQLCYRPGPRYIARSVLQGKPKTEPDTH